MKAILLFLTSILIAGCSIVGQSKTETAPYQILKSDLEGKIEVRTYESLVLASTTMEGDDRNGAFRKLFKYITGDNRGAADIAMTTPVIMAGKKESGTAIPMTTPVFMEDKGDAAMMSFVLPASYTIDTAPKPKNPAVILSEVKDYTVAAIIFSGTLSDKNVVKNRDILMEWLIENKYQATGDYQKAAYNAPFTLPMFRRNEILIPIEKP